MLLLEFDILYDDKDIVVCVKPQDVISQSDIYGKENMVSLLKEKLSSDIFPVHRLDKETGGIMVFAKNAKSAAVLSKDVSEQKLLKEYLAILHNDITPENEILTDLLFHDRQKNKSYIVKRQRKGVKKAVLKYFKLLSFEIDGECYSLVRVLLLTGRTHQIRVQFSYRGYSLLGDRKYGACDTENSLGLWAYKLEFKHPITKENLSFESLPYNIKSFENIDVNNALRKD